MTRRPLDFETLLACCLLGWAIAIFLLVVTSCAGRGTSIPPCRNALTSQGGQSGGGAGSQCEVRR